VLPLLPLYEAGSVAVKGRRSPSPPPSSVPSLPPKFTCALLPSPPIKPVCAFFSVILTVVLLVPFPLLYVPAKFNATLPLSPPSGPDVPFRPQFFPAKASPLRIHLCTFRNRMPPPASSSCPPPLVLRSVNNVFPSDPQVPPFQRP